FRGCTASLVLWQDSHRALARGPVARRSLVPTPALGYARGRLIRSSYGPEEATMSVQRLAGILGIALMLGAACTAAPASQPAPAAGRSGGPSAAGASAPTVAPAPEAVRLGLIAPLSGYWSVYAADALGYFAREGVILDHTTTGSPSQSAQLLASGDLDLAINTPDTAIIAITKGANLAIVASAQSEALFSLIGAAGVQSF